MLVKDLVRDTIWTPGADYDPSHKPRISVLLPAFRRAKSGMFRRCVESILSQTLKDIELIIIDDASTDGTADQVKEFLQKDGRVSSLRHPKNIGLPAISEYEGYLKARSDRLAFAFDDTMFNKDALEKLLRESEKAPHAMIYGHVEMSLRNEATGEVLTTRLGAQRSQGTLRIENFIPNNGVLLTKEIIEDVGFYDPHVLIARLCDWDLWRRVAERYEVKAVDVSVGIEDGPITNDSLGHTYTLDSWAVNEWMHTPRDERLLPANFGDYDVLEPDPVHGASTQSVARSLAVKHANGRGWPVAPWSDAQRGDGYILVVNLHYDASTYLYFNALPPEVAKRVRIISPSTGYGVEELARASCVIFVRHIAYFGAWIDAARAMKVPSYYFLDDNLPLLAEAGELSHGNEDYRLDQYRKDLSLFDGILLSSTKLVEYFEEQLLHDRLYRFPVSFYDQRALPVDYSNEKADGELVIACATGSHRAKGLWEVVFPALRKLANEGRSIHLVAPEPGEDEYRKLLDDLPASLRVTLLPFETDYHYAMRRFARYSPDLLLHAPSSTINNAYKTLHPLLSALIMNAVPVLPDTQPYDQIVECGNAVFVHDSGKSASWYHALVGAVDDRAGLQRIGENNAAYCAAHFSGKENAAVLQAILEKHGSEVPWEIQADRLHKLASWSRQRTGVAGGDVSFTPAIEQACELATFRRIRRYSWRHRIFAAPGNLWSMISPQFARLKAFSEQQGWRRSGSSLELSDSLHDTPFHEYRVTLPSGKLSALCFALTVDFVKQGQFGVELVSPENYIRGHIVVDLQKLDLTKPVRLDFESIEIKPGETWGVRVFAKSKTPVYVYEFVNRKWFGLKFDAPTPFMEMVMSR
ncbi:glycosyltransferase [Burkholderia sp. Ac-20353]|uniref:glycosyltransferase n=1 Tax=Burkholderia sp. Ac-20353 TaxID=2703894 RepID=UPI00197B2F05|nr:glycosyltransferase [Burkholderia sp. Ac-20353]MBN3791220.1 glycosyltransferase [Burkholderia sp. Ac-20353]